MLNRSTLWTTALSIAFLASVGWILLPGDCVVMPAGTSDVPLRGSVISTFLHPFSLSWIYFVGLTIKLSPIVLVGLAVIHWKGWMKSIQALAAIYAIALAAAVAFHPYRAFSDVDLIVIVSVWGIVVLVAQQSKASPGSALLALISVQLAISEIYSGLGMYRGLPFWVLLVCLSIVFSYAIFHYSRPLRHTVLGRYTEIRRIDPASLARRRAIEEQRRRLEKT